MGQWGERFIPLGYTADQVNPSHTPKETPSTEAQCDSPVKPRGTGTVEERMGIPSLGWKEWPKADFFFFFNVEPYWDFFCQTDSTKWKIHWHKTSASVHSKCRLQYTKVYQGHTSINRQNSLQLLLLHLKIYNKIYILKVYFTQLLPFSIV